MNIPIVDARDQIINMTVGSEIEEDLEGIYRVAALWVMDKDNNIMLSERSLSKTYRAGLWGPAMVGIVEEQHTYAEYVKRISYAYLGLELHELIVGPKIFVETSRKYFVQFFVHILLEDINPALINKEEIEQVKWFSKEEIDSLLLATPEIFSPLFKETYDTMRAYEIVS